MNKINFGWKQFYRPLPKPIKTLITSLKVFLGTLAGMAFVAENKNLTIGILVFGALLDFVLNFFADAPEVTLEKTVERLERDKPSLDVAVVVQEREQDAQH